MHDISLKEIFRIIILKPTTEIDILLNQDKFKYVYLFPVFYGILIGVTRIISDIEYNNISHLLSELFFSLATMTIIYFILIFIYAWSVKFFSNLLNGDATFNLTFGLISYSLVPMIVGVILYLLFKIFSLYFNSTWFEYSLDYKFFFYSQSIFILWSLFIIVLGNAVINSFSIIRSLISTTAIIFIVFLLIILGND